MELRNNATVAQIREALEITYPEMLEEFDREVGDDRESDYVSIHGLQSLFIWHDYRWTDVHKDFIRLGVYNLNDGVEDGE